MRSWPFTPGFWPKHTLHGMAMPSEPHERPRELQMLYLPSCGEEIPQESLCGLKPGTIFCPYGLTQAPKEVSQKRDTQQTLLLHTSLTGLPGTSWERNSGTPEGARDSSGRRCHSFPLPIAPQKKVIEKQPTYLGWSKKYWPRRQLMQAGRFCGV